MASFLLTLTPIVILFIAWRDVWIGALLIPFVMTWIGKCLRDGAGFPRMAGGKVIGSEYLVIAVIGVMATFMAAELVEMFVVWMAASAV